MSEGTRAWVWGELLKAVLNGRLTNVRFVLCGISHPPLDRDMDRIIDEAKLAPLGHADIVEYLALRGVEEKLRPDLADMLLGPTEGKPINLGMGWMTISNSNRSANVAAPDILAEFEQLMATTTDEAGVGSTELLMLGMEPADVELLQRCAIPHQFSVVTLGLLAPELSEEMVRTY